MQLPLAEGFGFDFALRATQPPMLNGDAGYSRKGPRPEAYSRKGARPEAASYYYSVPQLDVSGVLLREGREMPVTGKAWLDHEWSSSYLDERAQGWDWIGMNLDDGGALMAFRIRGRDGAAFWTGGTLRSAAGATRAFDPVEIEWTPLREWQSPRTGARYPVAWRVRAGATTYEVRPLLDDQEQDARGSARTVYWEGACDLLRDGRRVGAGYLELTGYWRRLRL
jgi:predicted secreted hydrolase